MLSGAEQFKDWMWRRWPKSERPARDTAEYFGWDETFISKIVNGTRSPGLQNAIFIERRTGIPVEAWVTSEVDTSELATGTDGRKSK